MQNFREIRAGDIVEWINKDNPSKRRKNCLIVDTGDPKIDERFFYIKREN